MTLSKRLRHCAEETWPYAQAVSNTGKPETDNNYGRMATAALEAADEIDRLTARLEEAERWKTWGIIEVAVRNPNVKSYMDEWEGRATAAEAKLEELKIALTPDDIENSLRDVEERDDQANSYAIGRARCRLNELLKGIEHD